VLLCLLAVSNTTGGESHPAGSEQHEREGESAVSWQVFRAAHTFPLSCCSSYLHEHQCGNESHPLVQRGQSARDSRSRLLRPFVLRTALLLCCSLAPFRIAWSKHKRGPERSTGHQPSSVLLACGSLAPPLFDGSARRRREDYMFNRKFAFNRAPSHDMTRWCRFDSR
jgi:hypothetical protein